MANGKKQIIIRNPEILALADWGKIALASGIVPPETNIYQAIAIVQAGKEIGIPPLQALRSMSFIRGRLSMSVQLQLAQGRRFGVTMDEPKETDHSCTVTLHRGNESVTCSYTLDDAKKAGLVKPGGSYEKYLRQMLRWRAIGDGLRLIAPDAVMGLLSPEEAESLEDITKPKTEQEIEAEFEEVFGEPKEKPKEEIQAESNKNNNGKITENQFADMVAKAQELKVHMNAVQNHSIKHYEKKDLKTLTFDEYKEVLGWIEKKGMEIAEAKK
jgi:hypothetical protein